MFESARMLNWEEDQMVPLHISWVSFESSIKWMSYNMQVFWIRLSTSLYQRLQLTGSVMSVAVNYADGLK